MDPLTMTDYESPAQLRTALSRTGYLIEPDAATVVFLAGRLEKPILVEGPAGVGKTELALALAQSLDRRLIRLQCYEGLDEGKALYEWQYGKQLLYSQILKDKIAQELAGDRTLAEAMDRVFGFEDVFFSTRFLQPRPLLTAITSEDPVVLLIDEVDKSDAEFEAFLLEVLSAYTVSIPEIGTIRARTIPRVILTSNNTREMSDALKRRCLHLYLDFPGPEAELEILRVRRPDLAGALARQVVTLVDALRRLPLKKQPGISETLDWAAALLALSVETMDEEVLGRTLGVLLKFESDMTKARQKMPDLMKVLASARG
jgi:MoxR-like ATPase